jgi:hypothetical protein
MSHIIVYTFSEPVRHREINIRSPSTLTLKMQMTRDSARGETLMFPIGVCRLGKPLVTATPAGTLPAVSFVVEVHSARVFAQRAYR